MEQSRALKSAECQACGVSLGKMDLDSCMKCRKSWWAWIDNLDDGHPYRSMDEIREDWREARQQELVAIWGDWLW